MQKTLTILIIAILLTACNAQKMKIRKIERSCNETHSNSTMEATRCAIDKIKSTMVLNESQYAFYDSADEALQLVESGKISFSELEIKTKEIAQIKLLELKREQDLEQAKISAYKLQETVSKNDAKCKSYGLKTGTESYANCRIRLEQVNKSKVPVKTKSLSERLNDFSNALDEDKNFQKTRLEAKGIYPNSQNNTQCGFKSIPPFGCKADSAICMCGNKSNRLGVNSLNQCEWVYTNC